VISGINHITLATSDLERSLSFYRDILGCELVHVWGGGAYLEAGGIWLCLSYDAGAQGGKDYTHIAFDVEFENFEALTARIVSAGMVIWKENRSEGESLYFCDPDGHRLEVHVGNLASRLKAMNREGTACGSAV
jgi:catechol 2,3-dioxygenase-like lactoylglutathione lyase family enzyme